MKHLIRVATTLAAAFTASAMLSTATHAETPAVPWGADASPGANLITSAVSKLTADELSALLSPLHAVALGGLDDVDTASGKTLNDVLRIHHEMMARFKAPLQFIGPDGERYDCYADYVADVWGGYGLPCY